MSRLCEVVRPIQPGSRVFFVRADIHFTAAAFLVLALALLNQVATVADGKVCDVAADAALGDEDYPTAIALHRRFLRSNGGNGRAHYHLGFAYGMVGRVPEEISEYRTALRLGLRQWDLWLNLGLAYLGQHDLEKATAALESAVFFGRDHAETHFNLAVVYERKHRLFEALREIAAARRLAPEDLDVANTNATICAQMGDASCARDIWTHIVQVAPDYAAARVNLMILSQRQDQVRQSELPSAFSNLRTQIGAIRATQGPR